MDGAMAFLHWTLLLLAATAVLGQDITPPGPSPTPADTSAGTLPPTDRVPDPQGTPGSAEPRVGELEDEGDNQENILSQLLGDYDKVKAISEGKDCQCKCVVKPLSREACQRIDKGTSQAEDSYTVETITSGPHCKCACIAPPSALNPCEGDFRLKKLRETENSGFKLSSIIEMLEGAFYGLDLLKLHAVTTKIVGRVEKLEQVVTKNLTKEQEQIKENVDEIMTELNKKGKENCTKSSTETIPDIGGIQRDAAAAYINTEDKFEERFLRDEMFPQDTNAIPLIKAAPPVKKHRTIERQIHLRSKPASKPAIIRGITYYKAKFTEDENDIEEQQDEFFSGDGAIDLLIEEDQLLKHKDLLARATREPFPVGGPPTLQSVEESGRITEQSDTSTWEPASYNSTSSVLSMDNSSWTSRSNTTVESVPVLTTTMLDRPFNQVSTAPTATSQATTTNHQPTTTPETTFTTPEQTTTLWTTTVSVKPSAAKTTTTSSTATDARTTSGSKAATSTTTARAAHSTKNPARAKPGHELHKEEEEDDLLKVIGSCKDTLSTITGPTTQNTYGRNEGAWMKDPLAKDEKIYVTNYYYGNNLVEFRNIENFKQGRWSNSYKLPYSWIGTGHVVYNGAFYYNRAFTRNLIKYDLKQRYVASWSMLHDVVYEEATPWRWRGHSDIDFAVDENGLWVIYPAFDDEGFQQDVIVLSKLNPIDLTTTKETTWRTGLRKDFYGNCFVICGVLYAVDSYNKRNANISYAFDTHTNTQIIPRLLFENEYSYTTQIDYNPKDRLLYAWDNGHQVTYNVIFAY
ncbi:olfactomedin-like protein 2B [Ambystoma mexicanum]|uniref:olfactomedin-like protein 2B n=1 Tax=Ambystoma mexicanum TaxID=8296 RepID=UPI0037E950B0